MVQHARDSEDDKYIASNCVTHFPDIFSGKTNANLMKATRWWQNREQIIGMKNARKRYGLFSFSTVRKYKRVLMKAMTGRGRKITQWVCDL